MLYVSTKNNQQTFTAAQALRLSKAPDDGIIVPMQLPQNPIIHLDSLCDYSFGYIVATILNRFFSTGVKSEAVDALLKQYSLTLEPIDRKTMVVQLQNGSYDAFERTINCLLTGNCGAPTPWVKLAIKTSVLFGICGELRRCGLKDFDLSVLSNALWGVAPAYYACQMGLPVGKIICACTANDSAWTILRKGETGTFFAGLELILHANDQKAVCAYNLACSRKTGYTLPQTVTDRIYAAVVSEDRVRKIKNALYMNCAKQMDASTAVLYGALQDYRSDFRENRVTLLWADC